MTTTKSFSGVQVKAGAEGRVSAVIATFSVIDRDGDVVLPGAIRDGAEVVLSAYGHASHGGALPVGKGVIRTTSTEAIIEGQFFMDTEGGRETFAVVKGLGSLQEWSWSLHDVKGYQGTLDGQPANFIESVRIKEVSPVLLGASIGTRTLAAKSASNIAAEREFARFVRAGVIAAGARIDDEKRN